MGYGGNIDDNRYDSGEAANNINEGGDAGAGSVRLYRCPLKNVTLPPITVATPVVISV